MITFYRQPRGRERFEDYLRLALNEARNAPQRPIFIYNPMGREQVLTQLEELRRLDAEGIARQEIETINMRLHANPTVKASLQIALGLNLADDIGGGWTNRYTTDYSLRFPRKITALHRQYCTPIFWTSDALDTDLIRRRVGEALWRSVYWLSPGGGIARTLAEHLQQEINVSRQIGRSHTPAATGDSALRQLYREYRQATGPADLFALLYGDEAAASLGHRPLGAGKGLLALPDLADWDVS